MGIEEMDINKNIGNATKWSSFAEIVAKLISPITNMILARLLTPEIFGIVATVTMVFSFADMFTDAGFQKYIVQKDFVNDDELYRSANVAFWSNFAVSLVFWAIIVFFSDQIATLVGCNGLGRVFIIACISLPLTSFSSIQMAIYRRNFDFKTLFKVRLVGVLLPLFVTVPIAFFTHSYWALIIGTICGNLSNAIILTVKSKWKPRRYYSLTLLKEMLSFSMWSLVEAISIWMTNYIGIFIVGTILSSYYLGIYKTSMTTVNQFTTIITSSITPVLFAALSRLQNDRKVFEEVFFKFQRLTSYLVVPMGIGIYLYRDLITNILLGSQWSKASGFVGLWGLVSSIKIIYSNYCYEVYRAYGRPKLAVFSQLCQLVVLVPTIYFTAKIGFVPLYISRSLVTVVLLVVNQIVMKVACDFSPVKMIQNTYSAYVGSAGMVIVAHLLRMISRNVIWDFVSIAICIGTYFILLYIAFPKQRDELRGMMELLLSHLWKKKKGIENEKGN